MTPWFWNQIHGKWLHDELTWLFSNMSSLQSKLLLETNHLPVNLKECHLFFSISLVLLWGTAVHPLNSSVYSLARLLFAVMFDSKPFEISGSWKEEADTQRKTLTIFNLFCLCCALYTRPSLVLLSQWWAVGKWTVLDQIKHFWLWLRSSIDLDTF